MAGCRVVPALLRGWNRYCRDDGRGWCHRAADPRVLARDGYSGQVLERCRGRAAKTWATAPRLKTVVLIGSMVSGAMKSPLARAQNDRMDNQAGLVDKPGSTSQRAKRTPPSASRYPSERSCLSRVMASARSPVAIVVSPQSAD